MLNVPIAYAIKTRTATTARVIFHLSFIRQALIMTLSALGSQVLENGIIVNWELG